MFGLTTVELRLASYAFILVGIAGFTLYERRKGAETIITRDNTAETVQAQKDLSNARTAITQLKSQLDAIPNVAPAAAPMRLCKQANSMPSRSTATGTESAKVSISSTDPGMQTGTQSDVDIGSAVQDITLAGVLSATNAQDLWKLMVKESQ